jgi:hypothetical protein
VPLLNERNVALLKDSIVTDVGYLPGQAVLSTGTDWLEHFAYCGTITGRIRFRTNRSIVFILSHIVHIDNGAPVSHMMTDRH